MLRDDKVIEDIKNGNSARINFFKNKIKEELEKSGIKGEDATVNEILKRAMETYTANVKLPFLFHIKALIKNNDKNTDTSNLSQKEYDVIKLYLTKENDEYLSRGEIADRLRFKLDEVIEIIEKLQKDEYNIESIFPNYKALLKERESFFENKNNVLSEKQTMLLIDYCGVFDKDITLKKLARKNNTSIYEIKKELKNIFKLLNIGNNLENLLEKYSNIKDTLIERSIDVKVKLKKLDDGKNSLIATNFKRKVRLNKYDVTMLNLLDSYNKMTITEDEIKKAGFKSIEDFITERNKFIGRIKSDSLLLDYIDKLYPSLDIRNFITMPRLTASAFRALKLMNSSDIINDEEELKENGFSSINRFNYIKHTAILELKKSKYLLAHALLVLEDLKTLDLGEDQNKKDEFGLTEKERKMLTLLNEHGDLTNKELAEMAGFKSIIEFSNRKYNLLRKIKANKDLYLKVISRFPNIIMKKEKESTKLSDKNKELLSIMASEDEDKLSTDEITLRLGYSSPSSYSSSKSILINRLHTNESLKREALLIYPSLMTDSDIKNLAIRFTSEEIRFLQEFCFIRNNNLVYQSDSQIGKKINLNLQELESIKNNCTVNVVKNMAIGNNLDIILWPNFTVEFITRENFKENTSLDIDYSDLKCIEKEKILEGVNNLEQSIFKDYVSTCTLKEKVALALRLGYFSKRFFTSEEVSIILDMSEIDVITLTKDCLNKSKNIYIEKTQKTKVLI